MNEFPSTDARYVQVPVAVVTAVIPDAAFAQWCVQTSRCIGQSVTWASRAQLAADLGRSDAASSISRNTTVLITAGLLDVRRRARRTSVSRPLGRAEKDDGRRYVELPHAGLRALSEGRIRSVHLRSLCRWLTDAGSHGWTADTLTEHAARWGISERTAKSHRSALVTEGLLEVRQEAGRTTLTARPGHLPERAGTGAETGTSPGQKLARGSTSRRSTSRRRTSSWLSP